jgi:alginate O-acetyltransferase complex protein AlgI
MLFQTPLFLAFFAAVVALLCVFRGRRTRHGILLVASYVFYGTWDWRFLGLILFSTLLDYAIGLALVVHRSRGLLWLSVATNLGVLGVFKYYDFFVASAVELLERLGVDAHLHSLGVLLPVGISFYTFQSLSYTVDVYRRELPAERSFVRFALFVAFFPQLVAGPIVRARQFLPQLDQDGPPRRRDFAPGALLFAVGLFKKVAISDHLASLADRAFAEHATLPWWTVALGVLCYAFQIYMDFSGYSDMAIGSARILGYRLPRNFELPYLAASPREFWRRWHVSLSTWLRDYLYVPLGGNRRGPGRTRINLLLTMLLGGLWHGANWTFLLWGAWHGALLMASRRLERLPRALSHPVTLLGVLAGWVVFRSTDLEHAASVFASAWTGPKLAPVNLPLLAASGALGLALVGHSRLGARVGRRVQRASHSWRTFLAGALLASAFALAPSATRPFLYFQF